MLFPRPADSSSDPPGGSRVSSPQDKPDGRDCESGIAVSDADEQPLSDPQAAGDERAITVIPVLHTPYDSYNLI
jgi:hypothetical protein